MTSDSNQSLCAGLKHPSIWSLLYSLYSGKAVWRGLCLDTLAPPRMPAEFLILFCDFLVQQPSSGKSFLASTSEITSFPTYTSLSTLSIPVSQHCHTRKYLASIREREPSESKDRSFLYLHGYLMPISVPGTCTINVCWVGSSIHKSDIKF